MNQERPTTLPGEATVPAGGGTLSEQLRDVARKLGDDAEGFKLLNLANALEGGPSAGVWRVFSPIQAFDVEWLARKVVGSPRGSSLVTVLEVLRNTLIFAPILVTWAVISQALGAYRDLIASQPSLIQVPFLYLWEAGFQGRGVISLSLLAQLDVDIILLLIVLTFAASLLRDLRDRANEGRVEAERHTLFRQFSEATFRLVDLVPYDTANTMERLDQVGRALLADMREDRKRLEQMEQRQIQQSIDLRDASVQLKAATEDLGGVTRILGEIIPRLDTYLSTIAQTQATVAQVQTQLQVDTHALAGMVTRIVEQQDVKLTQTLAALTDAAHRAEQVSVRLDSFYQAVGEQQRVLVQALEHERVSQQNLCDLLEQRLSAFETALYGAAAYAKTTYGIAVDVREVATGLPIIAASLRNEIRDTVDLQAQATRTLEAVFARLDEALARLSHPERVFEAGEPTTLNGSPSGDGIR